MSFKADEGMLTLLDALAQRLNVPRSVLLRMGAMMVIEQQLRPRGTERLVVLEIISVRGGDLGEP